MIILQYFISNSILSKLSIFLPHSTDKFNQIKKCIWFMLHSPKISHHWFAHNGKISLISLSSKLSKNIMESLRIWIGVQNTIFQIYWNKCMWVIIYLKCQVFKKDYFDKSLEIYLFFVELNICYKNAVFWGESCISK